jgi:hypothetical protein
MFNIKVSERQRRHESKTPNEVWELCILRLEILDAYILLARQNSPPRIIQRPRGGLQ